MSAEAVELSAGEKVIWSGRAERLPWFVAADAFLVPFTFLWAGLAISSVFSSSRHGGVGDVLITALFVAVGLYISIGRLIVRRVKWRRNSYTVTTQRVVVSRGSHEESDWLDQLPPPVTSGKHSLGFGSNLGIQGRLAMEGWPLASLNTGWWGGSRHPVFVGVEDAAQVRGLVRSAQNEARSNRSVQH